MVRNTVKKRIMREFVKGIGKVAIKTISGKAKPIPSRKGVEHPLVPREMASEATSTVGTTAFSVATEILPQSSATEVPADVDEFLKAGSPLTRSNPTAAILVKVDSGNALKYEGSMLYQNEKGKWIADLEPEKILSDSPSTTHIMGDRIVSPTPTLV